MYHKFGLVTMFEHIATPRKDTRHKAKPHSVSRMVLNASAIISIQLLSVTTKSYLLI